MTREEQDKALRIAAILAETIRELGEIPSGHLYARVMNYMSLDVYTAIITAMKNSKIITEKNHVLKWVTS